MTSNLNLSLYKVLRLVNKQVCYELLNFNSFHPEIRLRTSFCNQTQFVRHYSPRLGYSSPVCTAKPGDQEERCIKDDSKANDEDLVVIGRGKVAELLDNAAEFREPNAKYDPSIIASRGSVKPVYEPKSYDDVWNSSPYPKGSVWQQSQAKHSKRPKCDPKDTSIIMFPGQGVQHVGMVKELLNYPNVKVMFEVASSILKYDLLQLCLHGPKSDLDKTIFCQPALLVTSLAAVEKLRHDNPNLVESCMATVGFSLGEITALVFAGSITFEQAVKVVQVRAEAMQCASDMIPSGMMTVFYGPDSKLNFACLVAREHCAKMGIENPVCQVASYLYPHCKVIAGHLEALKFIEKHGGEFNLRKVKRVPVSGAFHTPLMEPAVAPLKEILKRFPIKSPLISVHSNVDGKRYKNAEHIIKQLPKQLVKPVSWEQTLHILYERNPDQQYPQTLEVGPGQSLKSILKLVNAKAALRCTNVLV